MLQHTYLQGSTIIVSDNAGPISILPAIIIMFIIDQYLYHRDYIQTIFLLGSLVNTPNITYINIHKHGYKTHLEIIVFEMLNFLH